MATEWDENEFLEDMESYIETELQSINSGIQVRIVDTFDLSDNTYNSLEPPFVVFKDGNSVNVKFNGCEIEYEMPLMAVVKVPDESGGGVYGRAPKTTYFGIVQLIQYVRRIFRPSYIIDPSNFDMDSQYIDIVHWIDSEPSEPYRGGGEAGMNIHWQKKMINIYLQLRRK
jgi:hypothetical protein